MSPGIWAPRELQCDFCSSPDVAWRYKCKDFNSASDTIGILYSGEPVTLQSVSDWISCDPCSKLIDAMELEELVNRACVCFVRKHNIPLDGPIRQHVDYTYQLFFMNKIEKEKI